VLNPNVRLELGEEGRGRDDSLVSKKRRRSLYSPSTKKRVKA